MIVILLGFEYIRRLALETFKRFHLLFLENLSFRHFVTRISVVGDYVRNLFSSHLWILEINVLSYCYTKWPLGSIGSLLCFGINPFDWLPKVENSGNTLSRASRESKIGRLFCGVEHTGGVMVGLEGTTTRNGLFPVPNLPECLPNVAAGPIRAVLPAGRLK